MLMAELAQPLATLTLPPPSVAQAPTSGLVPAGAGSATAAEQGRLKDLQPDALSDFLATILIASPDSSVPALIAADEVARDQDTAVALAAAQDVTAEWEYLSQAVEDRIQDPLASQGASRLRRLRDRVTEAVDRGVGVPGYDRRTTLWRHAFEVEIGRCKPDGGRVPGPDEHPRAVARPGRVGVALAAGGRRAGQSSPVRRRRQRRLSVAYEISEIGEGHLEGRCSG